MTRLALLDLTFGSAAENLACDEVLLDRCELGEIGPVLRFWSPAQYFIVLGYANKAASEVNLEACAACKVPIFRRCSGGGTVLQGPGCLNYSLALRFDNSPELASITQANATIMARNREAMTKVAGLGTSINGCTDLTIGPQKFSGNSQRRKRRALLFHGTFLLNFDLALVEELLKPPSKEPAYRAQRRHREFLTNLNVPMTQVKDALTQEWNAVDVFGSQLDEAVRKLAETKYSRDEWNRKW
ncbi:MAG TPA: lipoate--protein ligase family protein [Verrucomicrobiae bacterium]|jgi:lipoate-protein ligase A